MTAAALSALLSYWRRNPLQLFTLVAGLALATALWSGVQALNSEARASYDAAAAVLGEGRYDQLVPRSGDTISQNTYIALRRAGWLVGPVLEGRFGTGDTSVRIVGIDPLTMPGGTGPVTQTGDVSLETVLGQRVLFAHPEVADALAEAVAQRVIADLGVAPGTALTDIGAAQQLLDRQGEISRFVLSPVQPLGRPPLETVAPDLVERPSQQSSDIGQLTDSFHLNLTAFGLLSFAVGIFIVHGAIGLAFEQRRGMIRTLRTLGLPLRHLIMLMAAELALIGLVSGGLGVALGYLLAASLLPDVAATLRGLYGAQISGVLHLQPVWWLSSLGIALLGTALASAGAFWQIARMPVLSRGLARASAMATGRHRGTRAAIALLLVLASGVIIAVGSGLIGGFASLACLLIGAAFALPLVLDLALAFGQRHAATVRREWFWADTRQQLPGLSLALMALLLAMAANVGVSTMVSSFRLTFVGFLDQRLASDLYVATEDVAQAARLETLMQRRGETALPLLSVETRLAGQKAEVNGARVGPSYTENWVFLAQDGPVWERVADGDAVIVNEQLARRAELWPGDTLLIAPGRELPIAGVVGDYGNPIGQAVIAESLFRELFPDVEATRFGLRTDDREDLREALKEEIGIEPGQIMDQAALKAFSLEVFDRTFTVTAALNVLTLAVAGFAILMSLLTLAGMRVPQLAPVWALGLTRRELGRVEILRTVLLAALTLVVAVPLGLAMAWILLAVVNVAAFGWRLPMHLFPGDYAVLAGSAIAAAVAAALWPALRLARTPPSELLKVFANEA